MAAEPAMQLVDEEGTGHRLWLVSDGAEIDGFTAALRDRPVVIADGHHRYETALNFRNERQASAPPPHDAVRPRLDHFVLMNLVQSDDPGLVILPTHRVIRRRPACAGETLTATLARYFSIRPFPLGDADPVRSLRGALAELAQRREGAIACAVYTGGREVLILELADPSAPHALLSEGRAAALANLDVAVVHRLLIETILEIPAGSQADDSVQYTRDESQALMSVRRGDAALAVFLNPPRVEQVQAVAMAGDRMPQKSTFFFPKVVNGLVINPLSTE
jgi:uncharacterized protein (DUF1015 family)